MRFASSKEFRQWPAKAVTIFGMSGAGKTTLAWVLRQHEWFHYSVDYRIGTRYMGEHIVDNFKREAMKNPFLRNLLLTDSIYLSSNITFDNLAPLSLRLEIAVPRGVSVRNLRARVYLSADETIGTPYASCSSSDRSGAVRNGTRASSTSTSPVERTRVGNNSGRQSGSQPKKNPLKNPSPAVQARKALNSSWRSNRVMMNKAVLSDGSVRNRYCVQMRAPRLSRK